MRRAFKLLGILPILSAFVPTIVSAQAPSREEVTPPTPDRESRKTQVKVDSSSAMERAPCPLETSDIRTSITSVQFSAPGGAAVSPELAPFLGSLALPSGDQPVKIVCDVRDQANAALRAAKYVASVQIPPQRIEDGILRLEVVTARIVEMRVKGDAGPYERLLQRRIEALKNIQPLNEAKAEEMLLLAGDVPGLDVQLALRPTGAVPGDVIGELTVSYRSLSVIANVQNYNSRQLGRETAYVRAEAYGVTGAADLTYLGLSSTLDLEEQKIVQLGHVMGLDDSGTSIALRGTYALSKPDIQNLKLRTRSFIASLELARPFVRSVTTNAGITAGLEFAQQKTEVLGGANPAPLNLDKITTLFARVSGNFRSLRRNGAEAHRIGGYFEFRQGLGLFGATQTGKVTSGGFAPSRFEGSARATIVRGAVDTQIGLGPIFDLAGEVRGQWSNKPLLNFDEFSAGNLTLGRGYNPGANSGDRAVGASAEIRAKLIRQPKVGVELFGFYDSVRLWNSDRNSTENDRVLRSVGGGARIILPGAMLLEVTYAHPRDKALSFDNRRPPDRVLFSLTTQLVPFGLRR